MNIKLFRDKVRYYRRLTGFSQQALAAAVGLYPTVLSAKLNNSDNAQLTYAEIKRIIQTLVEWEAVSKQAEVLELLEMLNLKLTFFSEAEWTSAPLNRLEALPLAQEVAHHSAKTTPSSTIVMVPPPLATAPEPVAPAHAAAKPRHNLPAQATPLVGREAETWAVCQLLRRADVRLVTLLGPGGIGKTRLGLRVATELIEDFEDGVFFVPLDTLQDAGLVAVTIAKALALKETKAAVLDDLKTFLSQKHFLLVLDNFEQLLAAAGLVAELLAAAPRLKILLTSRTVLKLYGEHQYNVPPLRLPDPATFGSTTQLEELSSFDAIQLFVQRARAVNPEFKLSPENGSAITQICALLAGIPLAIELVAANLKLFTPERLLVRLSGQAGQKNKLEFSWLAGGAQNLPPRQQALTNTLAWSYALLTPAEQQLFARLSVFAGSWTIEAASQVCVAAGEDASAILNNLAALLDKSMLTSTTSANGEPRFNMLIPLREYARQCLFAKPHEVQPIQLRHAGYFVELASAAMDKFNGPERGLWLSRLEEAQPNIRAVLDWTLEDPNVEPAVRRLGLQLVELMWMFWHVQAYYREGQHWLGLALANSDKTDQDLYAKILHGAGAIAVDVSDYQAAKTYYAESLAIRRKLGDKRGIAALLTNLGIIANNEGNLSLAVELYRESLVIRRELGHKYEIGTSLNNLSIVLRKQGKLAAARKAQEESLELWRELGYQQGVAHALNNLGVIARHQKDLAQAQAMLEESKRLYVELGFKRGIASSYGNLSKVARDRGEYDQAHLYLQAASSLYQELGSKMEIAQVQSDMGDIATVQGDYERAWSYLYASYQIWCEIGNRWQTANCLEGLANVAALQKQFIEATKLLGLAAELRLGTEAYVLEERRFNENLLPLLKAELNADEFKTAWEVGRTMQVY